MKKFTICWVLLLLFTGCSPIKRPISNEYKLESYSTSQLSSHPSTLSILVGTPDAVAGYQNSDMLYVKKPFELSAFANNVWVDPPASMLLPLIANSLQRSGYFYAVTSSPRAEPTDYRLDTQLIELQQNFSTTPSHVDLVVKVVLSNVNSNRVVASRLFSEHVKCLTDTPYGGVIAANNAVKNFTAEATTFVLSKVKLDSQTKLIDQDKKLFALG